MSGWTSLFDAAQEILVACEAALALSPGGPMGRAYVNYGPPAWDTCDQLTVHVGSLVAGDTAKLQPPLEPLHRIRTNALVDLEPFVITTLRCVPSVSEQGILPSPALIQQASAVVIGDLWAIRNHLASLFRANLLLARPSGTREFAFDPALPLRPAGGLAGWEMQLRTNIEGFTTL